jgi:hypothetical protein
MKYRNSTMMYLYIYISVYLFDDLPIEESHKMANALNATVSIACRQSVLYRSTQDDRAARAPRARAPARSVDDAKHRTTRLLI